MQNNQYLLVIIVLTVGFSCLPVHANDELDAVDVEAQQNTDPEVPGGIGLDIETLKTVPGSGGDPLRAIQSMPGIAVPDDGSAEPAVRGSRPEDNLYVVDFLPAGYLFHFGGSVSVFNDELVDVFNLYPAAFGAQYNGATGAVIDVELRDPVTDKLTTTLDISFIKAGALIEGPVTDNQSFYLAARASYIDLLLEDVVVDDEEGVEFVQFPKFTDYQGKYVWRLDDQSDVKLVLNGASDEARIDLKDNNEDILNEPDLIGLHVEDTQFHSQGLVWSQENDSGREIKTALGHSTSKSKDIAGEAGRFESTVDSWFLKGRVIQPLGNDHRIAVGGIWETNQADYDLSFKDPGCTEFDVDCSVTDAQRLESARKLTVQEWELFVEDTWFLNDRLSITPGLSLHTEDYLDKSFLEPRFRVEYETAPDWILTTGLGQYHQFPEFGQVEQVFGNPNLNHSESNHAVVGLEHFMDNGWEWKTELYYKEFTDLVTSHPGTRYSNDGEGTAHGIEALIKKDLTDRWSGWLSLSASKAERENTLTGQKFDFDFDQPLIATLVAQYKMTEKWKLGVKWWYHSGSPDTPIISGEADPDRPGRFRPVYGEINSDRVADYHRLDIRADRQFDFKRVDVTGYIELINAYNRKNVVGYDYNEDFSQREEVHQLPLLISFGIKAKF